MRSPATAVLGAVLLTTIAAASLEAVGPRWASEHPRDRLVGDGPIRDARDPWSGFRAQSEAGNAIAGTFDGCPPRLRRPPLRAELRFPGRETRVSLDGVTTIVFESQVDALASIDLDLTTQLTVSSILLDGVTPLAFSHLGDVLNVQFTAQPDSGDTVSIDVAYSGVPWNEGGGGFGGFWFSVFPRNAYSMGVGLNADPPSMGRTWFPCYDRPCDKATVALHVETPLNRSVIANGLLTGIDSTATDHTWHWQHDFPISTYLIAISVAPYRALSDTIVTDPRITVYFHAGNKRKSEVSFQFTDLMMEACETRFGPYPFDKFAFMTTAKGDMEHQTCVSHLLGLVDSTNFYDPILAHEMTHMWFGDCVTYGDWRDVWLSEGFATYGELAYEEYKNGLAAYHARATQYMTRVINSGQIDGVYDPTNKWGVVAYEKGACVLHMLRGVIRDDPVFWQVLRDYHTNHAYANAVTPDFLASVNGTLGDDLTWFFDPWVYGEGHPHYEYGWSWQDLGGGQYQVDVVIRQVQTTASLFDLPVDFRVQTAGGDFDFNERIAAAEETVSFVVTAEPTGLLVDPDDWILDEQTLAPTSVDFGPEVAASQSLRLNVPRPNPFDTWTKLDYYLPAESDVSLTVYDVTGRTVRTLASGREHAGSRTIAWDRRDDGGARVAAGVYWIRLEAGVEERTVKAVVLD